MKNRISLTIFCFLASLLMLAPSCKKANNDTPPLSNFTPAYIAPTQPGILQISQNSLVLHIGNTATIIAKIYNSDGTIQTSQPGFIWTVDNSAIASVSGGVITANSLGNALVTVTDGSHGLEFVNVSVIADTTTIPANQYFISFAPPVVTLQTGANGSFSYTVTTANGQSAAITPTFSTIASSGISITGNTVHAGNTTGLFNVIAVYGNDTLNGFLQVLVSNSSNTTADTTWKISELITFPTWFNKNNLVALPVRIGVTEIIHSSNGTDAVIKFQTSPDKIEINYPSVITVNSNGMMTSVAPGLTDGTIKYKNTQQYFFSGVNFNVWGSNWGNGNLNVCCSNIGDLIGYFHYYQLTPTPETRWLLNGCNNDLPLLGTSMWNPIDITSIDGQYYNGGMGFLNWGAQPLGLKPSNSVIAGASHYFYFSYATNCNKELYNGFYMDENHIKVTTNFGDQTLTRGVGDCTGSSSGGCATDSLALLNLLLSGGSGSTWLSSTCLVSQAGITTFTFNSGFSGTFKTFQGDSHTASWRIEKDLSGGSCVYGFNMYNVDGIANNSTGIIPFSHPYSGNTLHTTFISTGCNTGESFITKQ